MAVPKLRFKANDGSEYPDWKEKKLGNIFNTVTDYVSAGSFADIASHVKYQNCGYAQLIRTVDLKNGFSSKEQVFISKDAYEYLWRVCLDHEDGIILPNVGNCGEVYYYVPDKFPHKYNALAPNAILVRSKEESNRFMSYKMQTTKFQNQLKLIISPSGQTKFNKTEFKEILVLLPIIEEQQKIATLFSTIDTVITDCQSEVDAWGKYKRGVMQQLFSQKVRFKADDGSEYPEWKEKTLLDVANIYDGVHQTPLYQKNGVKFISVENIRSIENTDKFISEEAFERDFKIKAEIGDIFMTRIGSIGEASLLKKDEDIAYYVSLALIKCKGINPNYLVYFIESNYFQRELWKHTLHEAYPKKINKGDIGLCKVMFPSSDSEQQKIADCLSAFDEVIDKAKQKLDAYKQLKKGLLQQMFV